MHLIKKKSNWNKTWKKDVAVGKQNVKKSIANVMLKVCNALLLADVMGVKMQISKSKFRWKITIREWSNLKKSKIFNKR